MRVWLLFVFLRTAVAATTNPPWMNPEYETMQNITKVLGAAPTTYFVYEGTFEKDILINKPVVVCLIMRITDYSYGSGIALRKYRVQVEQKEQDIGLYLYPEEEPGYHVSNLMTVQDEDYQEEVAKMYLVYTDYSTCALFYYDEKEEYELWLYQRPDGIASACELLLALLSEKPRNVYYTSDCNKSWLPLCEKCNFLISFESLPIFLFCDGHASLF
uniref:Putative salivary lipocalin n=1 Tax=Ixodes ricinus TaxID=34613 RepID=A0A0K8R7W0_IXORI